MKIEAGKFYLTRDGRKVGPMERYSGGKDGFSFCCGGRTYNLYGGYYSRGEYEKDLIAEWTDEPEQGPIRTVTKKEIVPGVYGSVSVHDPGSKYVRINIDAAMSVADLTQAIETLTEIREALQ